MDNSFSPDKFDYYFLLTGVVFFSLYRGRERHGAGRRYERWSIRR